MNYLEVKVIIPEEKEALSEILIAFMAEQGFESFSEERGFLLAYITEDLYQPEETGMLMTAYGVNFETKIIPQQNWNEEWEKNFDPTVVENLLSIKAPFHNQDFNTAHTIIIEPKMSFGTGHHATTWMMCRLMADFDFAEASVLDYGCGTGILAIYAAMLGASDIIAVDIDEWAYENTIENAERNNVSGIFAIRGDINSVPERKYDFIFANINLNVLKKDIPFLASCMNKGSVIFFSGFLNNELPQIEKACADNGLFFVKDLQKDNWTACIFKK